MEHELIKIKHCPICNQEGAKHFLSALDHNVSGDAFSITKCNSCGFTYTNPKPSLKTISDYYKSENYISHSGTKKGIINNIYHVVRRHQISKKENLLSKLVSEKKYFRCWVWYWRVYKPL